MRSLGLPLYAGRRRVAALLVALALLVVPAGFAGSARAAQAKPAPAGEGVEAVWASYRRHWAKVRTFEASFTQRIEVAGIGGDVESGGRLYFEKPDKLRWNYEQGPPQSVVGDGQWIWIYQPDLDQAYRVDYHTAFGAGGLVGLLAGREELSERYRFALEKSDPGTVHLKLVPRQGAGETLDLILGAPDFQLRRVVVHDPAGSVTYMDFGEVKTNLPLDEKLFRFTAPSGVDIITDSAD